MAVPQPLPHDASHLAQHPTACLHKLTSLEGWYRSMNSANSSANDPADGDDDPQAAPQVVVNAGVTELKRFVSTIKNAEQQVGEHIIRALQHPDTVAVITSVMVGPDGQQHLVSAALDPSRAAQVNALLQSAVEQREPEEPCVGFHCLLTPKRSSR